MATAVKDKPKAAQAAKPETSQGEVMTLAKAKDQFKTQVEERKKDIAVHLPPEVKWDRFIATVMYAVSADPDLLKADRRSLVDAAIAAAQDGLLPDKRQGAFVIYNNKVNGNWVKKVQWLPMIGGVTKKVRESGQVKEFRTRVVYEQDQFEVFYGDDERIEHRPELSADRGSIVAAYAVLKLINGGVEREVMTRADLDAVRAVSKAQNGPWKDWEGEMCRKSVAHRLLKRCYLSPAVEQVMSRDEDHYDLDARGSNVGWRQVERKGPDAVPSAPSFDLTAEDVPADEPESPDVGTDERAPEPEKEERKKDAEPDPNVNDSADGGQDVDTLIEEYQARLADCNSENDKLDLRAEFEEVASGLFPPDAAKLREAMSGED